jgi:hypothetical protein
VVSKLFPNAKLSYFCHGSKMNIFHMFKVRESEIVRMLKAKV